VLGDGIELVDYRIYPSQDVPRIIGEIISTRDDMVDSPVVSIIFPELWEEGLAYAPPLLPVMRPGESNMIFGVLPAFRRMSFFPVHVLVSAPLPTRADGLSDSPAPTLSSR
jgi:hypothetical protein